LLIKKEFKFEKELKYDLNSKDGAYQRTTSIKKLKKYLPDFKFTPIEKGISTTINWFLDNYENIRK
jgi:GDP-L-fucose synthase